jgi:hypothetical protein
MAPSQSSRTRGRNRSRPQILSSPAPSFDGFDVHRLEGVFSCVCLRHPFRSVRLDTLRQQSQADLKVVGWVEASMPFTKSDFR